MSLNATVYCDCYERGMASLPPMPVEVGPDGSISARRPATLEQDLECDQWVRWRMCEHLDGTLWSVWIGNIARVAIIREFLERKQEAFPILLEKVVYSGTHGGDAIEGETVRSLGAELRTLQIWLEQERLEEDLWGLMQHFLEQMQALRELALRAGKPIVF